MDRLRGRLRDRDMIRNMDNARDRNTDMGGKRDRDMCMDRDSDREGINSDLDLVRIRART